MAKREVLEGLAPTLRFNAVTLITAFHPFFAADNFLKELRDAVLCTLKVMECMSIDFMALPIETLLGYKMIYGLQDSLGIGTTSYKWLINYLGEIRAQYVEPAMWLYFVTYVEPSKNFVERFVPRGHPFGAMPSLPSDIEGDWNVAQTYTMATAKTSHNQVLGDDAFTAPGYHTSMWDRVTHTENIFNRGGESILQKLMKNGNDSRELCNERPTEVKKLLCHIDYFQVQLRLGKEMIKRGEMEDVPADKKKTIVASFAQLEAKFEAHKQTVRDECEKNKGK